MSVIGPGARGVVVATPGAEPAAGQRADLEAEGIPAATLRELGLETPEPPEDLAGLARFWAEATRRPAVAGDAAAGPDGSPAVAAELRALLDRRPPRRVAVFGGAWTAEGEEEHGHAAGLGARLAEAGVQVVSGGYQGIMDAVSRGAAEAGGVAVGVTIAAWGERAKASRWMTHEARARDLFARLPLICDADAWVAFSGGAGTLAEVALCWNLLQADPEPARPLVVVGNRWGRALQSLREHLVVVDGADFDLLHHARDAEAALETVLRV